MQKYFHWPAFLPKKLQLPLRVLLIGMMFAALASFFYPGNLAMRYAMLWNMFLAGLPLLFACFALWIRQLKGSRWLEFPVWLLWLFFYPNSIYMLTDFIHLNNYDFVYNSNSPADWFGLLHLTVTIAVGCGFGLLSLWMLHRTVAKKKPVYGWILVAGSSALSGVGIWLGRCLRFNTWDIWRRPLHLLQEAAGQLNARALLLCVIFFAMSFGAYLLLYSLLGKERD